MADAPRAVLFDLDDTLADRAASIRVYAGLLADDFVEALAPVTPDEVHAALVRADDFGSQVQAERLLDTLPWRRSVAAEALVEHWADRFGECATPFEDVDEVLETLARRGVPLGLITNGGSAMQRAKIKALRLEAAMSVILISSEIDLRKPDPAIFNRALSALDCRPEQAWFVGDHLELDAIGARDAGLNAFWLRMGRPAPQTPAGLVVLDRLGELLTHLPQ